ncbi:MAG: SulP family inorganic anion transporter, partial [Patescibacteria group bacterium]|nr:SulP family inorganic anion transporter [Patescibacteria group bacterium]
AKNYSGKKFRLDMMSAMTVAIVALPQSMAYAFIAGVPAQYGLYAAMIPTAIASLFGSSRYLIAGPTNAISMVVASTMGSVVIAGTIAQDLPDDQKIALVFLLAFLVGIIQLLMGLFKMGSLINFVSHSVIVGFTAGAGILIAFNQIKNFIGVDIGEHSHFYEKMYHTVLGFPYINWYSTALGIFTVAFILLAKRFAPKLPGALLAMVFSAIFVAIFDLGSYGVELVAEIPQTLPPISTFPLDWVSVSAMLSSALAIAILGIVEALAIAKSIASSSGEKIDGNQELIGQGLSNISASFFSSIPGSGSFTRSAVNFKSGAASRYSGVFSALIIIIVVLVAAPLTRYIPIPSLAGILMVIAYSMIDKKAFALAFKSTGTDRLVLLVTMSATLVMHLEMAIYVGVALSLILFIRKVAMPEVKRVKPSCENGKLITVSDDDQTCPQLAIFQVEGSLFFGAVEKLEEKLHEYEHLKKEVIIIRMKQVNLIDATGVHAFEKLLKERSGSKGRIILSGVNDDVKETFVKSGIAEKIGSKNIVDSTEIAIKLAFDEYINFDKCKNCKSRIFAECPKEK